MIEQLIAEATECDFKVALEIKKPKSWLKSCCRTRYLSKLDNLFVKSFRSTRIAKLHDFIQKKALAAKIATRAFGL